MKKKQEREDAWEQEHKMLKMAKEKEINRLFTLQKSALVYILFSILAS